MRIALAQFNPIVGDIAGNSARMSQHIQQARRQQAQLVVFGELSIPGYPPRDLLKKEQFIADSLAAVQQLAAQCKGIAALVGYARATPGSKGRPLQNVAALLRDGKVQHVHVKSLLPTYDVFDEQRYFEPGDDAKVFEFDGVKIGLSICEDLWDTIALGRQLYGRDPIADLAAQGAKIIINMAASPYQIGKATLREDLFQRQAKRSGAAIVYVNQVGGNDELVFDGTSCVVSAKGEMLGRAKSFEEDLLIVDLDSPARCEQLGSPMQRLSQAIKLGLRDYVTKCGFKSVVLGLSGGIDSAVVAALACDALGSDNVHCLALPSRYSSDHSLSDAKLLADNLGVHYQIVPIETIHRAYEETINPLLAGGRGAELAGENIQARIRGNIIMAMSNTFGHLALATGNKSELSTGYCTLYGDMSGGLSPIGDVLKTLVFKLAHQLNDDTASLRIPLQVIQKPPSAELKPNQFDQDSLPPYDLLDAILERYIEGHETAREIVADGFDQAVVNKVLRMVDLAEYKRRQAAPVLKVTSRAFGSGRRMPIAQRYIPYIPSPKVP
jgi:NAD+ synthase (glutamine-hydrolysing)